MGQLGEGEQEIGAQDEGIGMHPDLGGGFFVREPAKEKDSGLPSGQEPEIVADYGVSPTKPWSPSDGTAERVAAGETPESNNPKKGGNNSAVGGESAKGSAPSPKERTGGKGGGKGLKGGSGPREGSRGGGKIGSEGGRNGRGTPTNLNSGGKEGPAKNVPSGASAGGDRAANASKSTAEASAFTRERKPGPAREGFPTTHEGVREGSPEGRPGSREEDGGGVAIGIGRWFSRETKWPDPGPKIEAARTVLFQTKEKVQAFVRLRWPTVKRWLLVVSRALLVLSLVALECGIRGGSSLFRLGSAALFVLIWCTALNLSIMVGFVNICMVAALSLAVAFLLGYTPAFAFVGIFGAVVLWIYGSFWTTAAVMLLGGGFFIFDHARIAILITMLYSMYSVKGHGGWVGLAMCTILAFVSSDVVVYFLSQNAEGKKGSGRDEKTSGEPHEQGSSKPGGSHHHSSRGSRQAGGTSGSNGSTGQGTPGGYTSAPYAEAVPNNDYARTSGGASTSGPTEGDPTSAEEEVARVLSSRDHYAVIGFSRYENFDVAVLKREYKKKAMLVHPDKNRGNEKAEEAFKRLQNAYEVLLDTIKRKTYDDDLRKEEVLSNLRQHRQGYHQNGRCGSPNCGCQQSDDEAEEDIPADSRRIACRKCNETHVWIFTDRSKLRARWCQECNDYHQAKDGDGWVEQSGQSYFFGMFQKVDDPHAFACAEGKVYDVTEWVICQGMKCPPNTHKPTFHVSTAGAGKGTTRSASRASRSGGRPNPPDGFTVPDFDENMTEHEFFDWLEQAMACGMFSDLNQAPGYPGARGAAARGGKPSRKKRKGKKQW